MDIRPYLSHSELHEVGKAFIIPNLIPHPKCQGSTERELRSSSGEVCLQSLQRLRAQTVSAARSTYRGGSAGVGQIFLSPSG